MRARWALVPLVAGVLAALGSAAARASDPAPSLLSGRSRAETVVSRAQTVRVLDLDGVVEPLSADYVVGGIEAAERAGERAVLLRLDTPGGLESSMRRIVGKVLAARIPVVCWVGPAGARAASAGTFVLLACRTAAMAPGTAVGAAHPVGLQGQVLDEKVTNDAAALIQSIAETRHRNAAWAERAVRSSVSASAAEALRLHVIDAVAASEGAALRAAGIRGARLVHHGMPALLAFLAALLDPNVAFLLLVLGLVGLVATLFHPHLHVAGFLGLVAVVLAAVMLEMLPVTVGGLVLAAGGVVFLVLEIHVPRHGLAAAAGVASLVVGGALLFNAGALVRVSPPVLGAVVACAAILVLVGGRAAASARRAPPPAPRSLLGAEGVATSDLDPVGTVRVQGEEWTAEAFGTRIEAGTSVRVVAEHGLRLTVERI